MAASGHILDTQELTKQLAQEYRNKLRITINVVCPSHTKTDMISKLSEEKKNEE